MIEYKVCVWFKDDGLDANDVWDTDCGHAFQIYDGSPSDNHMKFCCYCGKLLQEMLSSKETDELLEDGRQHPMSEERHERIKDRALELIANRAASAIVAKICAFGLLEKNWDSYGGRTISHRAIEMAKELAGHFTDAKWSVIPRSDGGIQFESDDLEVEITDMSDEWLEAADRGECGNRRRR